MIQKSAYSVIRLLIGSAMLLALAAVLGCASTPDVQAEFDRDKKARTHYNAGIEYMRQGKLAIGVRELRTAMQISPRDPWIHWAIAEAYRQQGRLDDAESHLLTALEIRPDFQQARLNLSALYVEMGRYEEAIELADQLLDDPTFPVPWKALTNRGWAEYELGQRTRLPARTSRRRSNTTRSTGGAFSRSASSTRRPETGSRPWSGSSR